MFVSFEGAPYEFLVATYALLALCSALIFLATIPQQKDHSKDSQEPVFKDFYGKN